MWVHWRRLGLGQRRHRDARLAVCSRLLGHPVTSTTTLDAEQTGQLLDVLRGCRDPAALAAAEPARHTNDQATPPTAVRAEQRRPPSDTPRAAAPARRGAPDGIVELAAALFVVWLFGRGLADVRRRAATQSSGAVGSSR